MTTIQQTLAEVQTSQAATPELHPLVTAKEWRYEVYHPALAPVLPAVQSFVSAILRGEEPRWLSLLGPSGIGKTFILRQAFKLLNRANADATWKTQTRRTPPSYRGHEIAHIIPSEDLTDYRAPADYGRYDLIYIEDIGAGAFGDKGSGAVLRSRIIELLQLRSGRWTMLDANLYRSDIADKLDPRIASRLKRDGSTCLELPASIPDYADK